MPFLDVEISLEGNKFVTNVNFNSNFSGIYTYFESCWPSTCKSRMIYNLVFCCFLIYSDYTKLPSQSLFLKEWIPSIIANVLKQFWIKYFSKKDGPQILTAEKRTLTLVLPFLGELSLQIWVNLQKTLLEGFKIDCKINIFFESQRDLLIISRFKNCLLYDLVSCNVHKFHCGRCNIFCYCETDRHLKIRSGEHTVIIPLTFSQFKCSVNSSICDCHLFFVIIVLPLTISSFWLMVPLRFYYKSKKAWKLNAIDQNLINTLAP